MIIIKKAIKIKTKSSIQMNNHCSSLFKHRIKYLKITLVISIRYLLASSSKKCLHILPNPHSISMKVLIIIQRRLNKQYLRNRLNLISWKLPSRSKLFSLRLIIISHWAAKRLKIKKEKSIKCSLKKMLWRRCDVMNSKNDFFI